MHPEVGPWHREGVWRRAKKRGSFEAVYSLAGTPEQRRAVVDRAMVHLVHVVQWAIENGQRLDEHPFPRSTRAEERRTRRTRPGKAGRQGREERV
jgi:hypothetical protein